MNSLCASFYDDTNKTRFLSKVILGGALACRLEEAAVAPTAKAASGDIGWKHNRKIKVGLSVESLLADSRITALFGCVKM